MEPEVELVGRVHLAVHKAKEKGGRGPWRVLVPRSDMNLLGAEYPGVNRKNFTVRDRIHEIEGVKEVTGGPYVTEVMVEEVL